MSEPTGDRDEGATDRSGTARETSTGHGVPQSVDTDPTTISQDLLERIRRKNPTERQERALARVDESDLETIRADRRTGLAFWLNVYNSAVQLQLDRRPELFESRWRLFRTHAVTVAGVELSLDDIDHGILRDGRSKYGLGYLPRLARTGFSSDYRLEADPRIHFALNCGAASCPAILAYEPETVDEVLDDATRTHLDRTVEYDPTLDRVRLPRVCLWFLGDFGGLSGLRAFLRRFEQVPPDSSPSLRFASYDWTKTAGTFAERSE